ncbi:FGGY family carbohydrate kinase [Shinella sp. CPCC 101442]|uniref:xylulokinase n=1 Tax=Shinella sp. CPCC 101442 TaxID=2932265 RepID=UPI00215277A0|nr:FGGY family carbohydrate kinase [Shinella sp. CPCC 101442]MCR6500425.1 FGGY family carbohydrate kinase [Shinella sp. CPCC 101442]
MFLGIDLGLGSLKVSLVDGAGVLVADASSGVRTDNPAPGRAEQHPADWERAMVEALKALGDRCDLSKVEAISFTAGTHSSVLLDEGGDVLRPVIMWSDQRAGAEAEDLNRRMQDRLMAIGHNRAAPTWSIAPLYWLRRNEADTVGRVRTVLFAKDWLRSRLTGDRLTDRIDAQGALMLDVDRLQWSGELCDAIGWDLRTMPEIRNPTDLAGHVLPEAAARYGLRAGTPVYVGTCDTAAEVWSAGAIRPGDTVVKLASAGVVNVVCDRPTKVPDVPSKGFVMLGLFYALGAINSCATAHKWIAELLFGQAADGDAFGELDTLAGRISAGSEGLLFHPYLLGERAPYWDPGLRASFVGMNITHGRGHVVRAFYEGIAFALRDAAHPMRAAGLTIGPAALIGGGAKSDLWAQVIADVLGVPLRRPVHGDASYGAALIAAVGAGAFANEAEAIDKCVAFGPDIAPDPERAAVYDGLFDRYRRVKVLLTEINHEISGR